MSGLSLSSHRSVRLLVGAVAVALAIAGFGPAVGSAGAATTPTVNLSRASSYAALSSASVGNTVSAAGAPFTTLRGDLGVVANAQPTGFPPGVVTGTTQVGNTAATQADTDLVAAYNEVAARTGGVSQLGDLTGATILPGLYTIATAASNTGTLTLDAGGNPNAIFVFQVDGALTAAAGSHVVLTDGAQASNVFWQVNGAAAIGANASFAGTLMAHAAVAVGNGSLVNGRAFALGGALTLDADEFYSVLPVVTITGGPSASTNSTTPTISGTTDVEAPGMVTVTVNGQALTATPSDGAWSVTSAILANGPYPVVASVTDGAGNLATFTQQLTVDTVPPVVTLDGGPSLTTNDRTPTISGTTDVAPGTIVRVLIDAQALTALVQSGGNWNVAPAPLSDGTRTLTASVTDPAGNQSTAGQTLTVDTVAPAVTIAGGANALTDDPTPAISGIADVAPGTTVTVTLADQTLTGPVHAGGAWSVTAARLSDGPHRVIMSVSDGAGNLAGFTQILTIDTVAPTIAITGGATASTTDLDPTITGTSDAAPGTTVTVSIAGQSMTTLVQAKGTWNATPTSIGEGTWHVLASVPDPAGNVGRARQTLTIASVLAGSSGGTSTTGATGTTGDAGSANRLTVIVRCPPGTAGDRCTGSLSATSRVTSRGGKPVKVTAALAQAAKKQRKSQSAVVRVASGSYSAAPGKRATTTLSLNSQGKKLLARFYRLRATLKITGTASATRTIIFSYTRVRAAITAKWALSKSSTSLTSLTISSLPAKARVTVACKASGCPFAKRAFSPKGKSLALASTFGNAKLKPGATIQITVSVAGQVGSVARFAVRSGRPPIRTSLCLVPGARKPAACAVS